MSQHTIDCSVCCESKPSKQILTCLHCNYQSCIPCAQTYLLSVHHAQCMNCNHAWDELFLRTTFPIYWIEKQYKAHVKAALLDIEKSYMTETMPYVAQFKTILQLKQQEELEHARHKETLAELEEKMAAFKKELRDPSIYNKKNQEAQTRRETIKHSMALLQFEQRKIQGNIYSSRRHRSYEEHHLKRSMQSSITNTEEKQDVHYDQPCIDIHCRGFLKDWTCGLCAKKVCKSCREQINTNHKCNPDTVASVKALQQDSKPCPKCKEPISRISGCNHMFCMWCKTSFDYQSGKEIDAKQNTNPHYYRWKAQQDAQTSHQQPQLTACGRQPLRNVMEQAITIIEGFYKRSHTIAQQFTSFLYQIRSVVGECNVELPPAYGPQHNRMARIKFLAKEYDEKQLTRDAMKEYKCTLYEAEMTQLKQMLHTTLTDWFYQLLQEFNNIFIARPETRSSYVDIRYFRPQEYTVYDCIKNPNINIFKEPIMQIPNQLICYFNAESQKLAKAFDYSIYECYDVAKDRLKSTLHSCIFVEAYDIDLLQSSPAHAAKQKESEYIPSVHFIMSYTFTKKKV